METTQKTIGEIVRDDFRAAAVFSEFRIDFCCKGNRTLDEVCEQKGISKKTLLDKLAEAGTGGEVATYFDSWHLDLMADYIEKKHHRYVQEKTPVLQQYLKKLCAVHGSEHPELFEIAETFNASAGNLAAHMKKEELILFPFIRKMEAASRDRSHLGAPPFGTVQNPIRMMMLEHNTEGENFSKISELSGNYTPPASACNTYRVTYQMLQDFEKDLHTHIHLENNILFPKAAELEKEFFGESVIKETGDASSGK
ncbi:MAG: iron-sulfur cluster repair di-iron protein [Bacteroidia bacterium]